MILSRVILSAAIALMLGGCSSMLESQPSALAQHGPSKDINAADVETFAKNQTAILSHLKTLTGESAPEEDELIEAGLLYVDKVCEDYLSELFNINRNLKADSRMVNTTGTLFTGLMGIGKAAAKEISAVAVLFGYAEESMNINSSRILFEMEPSAIRSLVNGAQLSFKNNLPTGYESQVAVFNVIREYTKLCLPSTIEAEINNAAKTAQRQAVPGDTEKGSAPKVSINPSQLNIDPENYQSSEFSSTLKGYVFPGGQKNDNAHKSLKDWMATLGINVPVSIFLMQAQYQPFWQYAVEHLKANGNPKLQ